MKKILSFALSVSMLATAFFCGLSASAEQAPIKATPITGHRYDQVGSPLTCEEIYSVPTINAKGFKVSASEEYAKADNEVLVSGGAWNPMIRLAYDQVDIALSDSTGIVFYVKTDSANKIYLAVATSKDNGFYENALYKTGTYSVCGIDETQWQQKNVVDAQFGDAGLVSFDSAFEGYVKIPYTSFLHYGSEAFNNNYNIRGIDIRIQKAGGQYGSTVIGPIMKVTNDSISPKIEVPEEFKMSPIKATPITGHRLDQAGSPLTWEEVDSVSTINAKGFQISASEEYAKADNEVVGFGEAWSPMIRLAYDKVDIALSDSTGIVFYVKTDSANKIYLAVATSKDNGFYENALYKTGTYSVCGIDETQWQQKNVVDAQFGDAGLVSFDSAFEGYVKIPYTSFLHYGSEAFNNNYNIRGIDIRIQKAGGQYGSTVIGPIMKVTNDSISPEIEVPEKFRPAPIEATVLSNCRYYNHNSAVLTETYSQPVAGLAMRGIKPTIAGDDMGLQADYPAASKLYSKLSYAESGIDKPLDASDATALLLYVEAQGDNVIVPTVSVFSESLSFDPDYALRVGAAYSYMRLGDTAWTTANAGASGYNETSSCFGTIALENGFKGWIKIDYSSFVSEVLYGQSFTGKDIVRITVSFAKIGLLDDGEHTLTVGPVAKVTADSVLTEIKFTETVYETGDINFDRDVAGSDLVVLRKQLLDIIKADKVQSDINGDKCVDILDLVRLKKIIAEKTVG